MEELILNRLDKLDDKVDRINNTLCDLLAEEFVEYILNDKMVIRKLEETIAEVFMERLEELE